MGFGDIFTTLKTSKEKRIEGRTRWKKIKKGAKAKKFLSRQKAARNLKAHRIELDEKGILKDQFDFLREPNPKWLKTRAFILKRDRFRCWCCQHQNRKNHVHHKIPRRYAGSSDAQENLTTLCPRDHSWVDLEIFRRIGAQTLNRAEVRSICYRVLETRKSMVKSWS